MKRVLGLILAALLAAVGAAEGEEVPSRPFLRIEPESHTAPLKGIDIDAAGRFLVTGSRDKTVRVWDLASGLLLQTLRPPIGENDQGKIYGVAISPDGELVAAGGETSFSIYLFERRSGRLVKRLSGLPGVVLALAFSPDGSRLAATLGGFNSLHIFHIPSGQELGRAMASSTSGSPGHNHGIAFAADGRLATASFDGKVRLYDRDLHLIASASAPGGRQPLGVAFSPDGRQLAVGYMDNSHVDVLDTKNLRRLYAPNTRGTNGYLALVAWSTDGASLYAGGTFGNSAGRTLIRRWADAGKGAYQDLEGPENDVIALRVLPLSRLVFGSIDPAWGVLDAAGRNILGQRPSIADFRNMSGGFRVGSDGTSIRFTYEQGRRPARFSIPERRLILDAPQDSRLAPPRTSKPGLVVTGWKDTEAPQLNGKPLPLYPFDMAHSFAIAPDGQSFLLGTDFFLRSIYSDGNNRWWPIPAPGIVWAVNLTEDGRLAVAAFADGTIRWYRADNGKELLAFFPHADGKRWVLWTPSGYYDTSVGGENLIGWHVNNGPDQEADFFHAWQFRDRFHKPEVIDFILETLDEVEALRRAGIQLDAQHPVEIQRKELPPVVTILDPADGTEVATPSVKVRVNVRSPSGKPVTRVWARVDGRLIESRIPVLVSADSTQAQDPSQNFERSLEVPLPPRDCIVEVMAEVAGQISTPAQVTLKGKVPAAPVPQRLLALVVGISEYAKAEYKLNFADDDARAFATLLREKKGKPFDAVEVRELVDQEATREALLRGLQWLSESVGFEDTAVVFVAGHAINTSEYFFLPYDADTARPLVTLLSQDQLQEILTRLRGRVLLFLDTCRAGSVFGGSEDERRRRADVTALLNSLKYGQGLVVFSAAQGRELSQESSAWGHGAFTKALLEALQGAADAKGDPDGEITITELEGYLTKRVRELTDGAQTPIQTRPSGVPVFTFIKVAKP